MRKCFLVISCFALLAACSSGAKQSADKPSSSALEQAQKATLPSSNPAAKYLELVGFRVKENRSTPGKLEVTFGVVNHSQADLGDLTLKVDLRSSAAKPTDEPICTFNAKVPALGPNEMKEVTAVVPTKLRAYELPDWQFLRSDFQILEPK